MTCFPFQIGEDCTQKINCDFRDEIISNYDADTIDLNIVPEYKCKPGFYLPQANRLQPTDSVNSAEAMEDCIDCDCNKRGTQCDPCKGDDSVYLCDKFTGQCVCHNDGIEGKKCDKCKEKYWQNFPEGLCDKGTYLHYLTYLST